MSIMVGICLAWIGGCWTVITNITETIRLRVGVGIAGIGYYFTILLIGIGNAWAVVTGITDTVFIGVGLIGIKGKWAIIVFINDAIIILITFWIADVAEAITIGIELVIGNGWTVVADVPLKISIDIFLFWIGIIWTVVIAVFHTVVITVWRRCWAAGWAACGQYQAKKNENKNSCKNMKFHDVPFLWDARGVFRRGRGFCFVSF